MPRSLLRGRSTAGRAPIFVFSSARLEAIESSSQKGLRRDGLGASPYWDPAAEQVAQCDQALWQRAHWSRFHDELPDYAIQYFGITKHEKPRVLMRGFCPRLWRGAEAQANLAKFPVFGMGAGRCRFQALCAPESGSITSFTFDVSHPR
jgi:hypothetical protein